VKQYKGNTKDMKRYVPYFDDDNEENEKSTQPLLLGSNQAELIGI
jgi:hypothetical protein